MAKRWNFRSIWKSGHENVRQVGRHWAWLIVTGAGGVLGLIAVAVPAPHHGSALVPTWVWMPLLFGGVIVAQFLAFHDVREQRDAVKKEMEEKFEAMRYRFALDSVIAEFQQVKGANDTLETGVEFAVNFANGATETMDYEVENMTLSVNGHTARAGEFQSSKTMILPGRTATFFYHWIPLPLEELGIGEGEYTVVYGHPSGGPHYRTHHEFTITWKRVNGQWFPTWRTKGEVTHEVVSL